MTHDEIIAMVKQTQFFTMITIQANGEAIYTFDIDALQSFAKLVEEKVIKDQHEFIKRLNGDAENLLREKGWKK